MHVRTRTILSALAALAAGAGALGAQSHGCTASSGGGSNRSSVAYLSYEQDGRTHLAAAVVFRGRSEWMTSQDADDAKRARAMIDSAHAAAFERMRIAGGTITTRGNGWVECDGRERTLRVHGRAYELPPAGSALVLLVDRVDGVGGAPSYETFVIPSASVPAFRYDLMRADSAIVHAAAGAFVRESMGTWDAALQAHPRIAAFVREARRD